MENSLRGLHGWQRDDYRVGIRNTTIVCYLVECARHVSERIVRAFDEDVQLVGFPGCYHNDYAFKVMKSVCTHPNVGAVLVVSLGCEGFERDRLVSNIKESGRPVDLLVIQESGGTRPTVERGIAVIHDFLGQLANVPKRPIEIAELTVGTICGGSDGTSGITANPAMGRAFDRLLDDGATCIFEETGELVGCETHMESRAVNPQVGKEITSAVNKAENYYRTLGHGSFAPGNAEGGLTTIEEKSLGAYSKTGAAKISGVIKPGQLPPQSGLWLLDVVPDGEVRFGFPNISDNAEITELISCGCHLILFSTGRGSIVGSAISPVIKVCANPETFEKMSDDMDINAGKILTGEATLDDVGAEIASLVLEVASGKATKSEELGHQEFVLGYKSFDYREPGCLPGH